MRQVVAPAARRFHPDFMLVRYCLTLLLSVPLHLPGAESQACSCLPACQQCSAKWYPTLFPISAETLAGVCAGAGQRRL